MKLQNYHVATDRNYQQLLLPTAIANVAPPPQLNPQPMINPPYPAVTVQDVALPTNVANHKPSLPPVTPCILDKIRKGEYIDFDMLTTRAMFRTHNTNFFLPLNLPLQVIHLLFNPPVATNELHHFLLG